MKFSTRTSQPVIDGRTSSSGLSDTQTSQRNLVSRNISHSAFSIQPQGKAAAFRLHRVYFEDLLGLKSPSVTRNSISLAPTRSQVLKDPIHTSRALSPPLRLAKPCTFTMNKLYGDKVRLEYHTVLRQSQIPYCRLHRRL